MARSRLKNLVCTLIMSLVLSGIVVGEEIFNTGNICGFLGCYGYDVSQTQSVAVGFTPDQTYSLDDVAVWIMSNDFDNPGRTYTLSVRTDAGGGATHTVPSNTILESWNVATQAVGWSPILELQTSMVNPIVQANTPYWVVAESNEPAGASPVWVVADSIAPFANIDFASGPNWQGAGTAGAPGTVINATLVPEPIVSPIVALGFFIAMRRHGGSFKH